MTGELSGLKGARVAVGLSGGVDSAVTAAMLVRAGALVTGVFAKGWYPPGMPCTWAEDRRDAMRVAAHLGIPFRTLDASAEYKKGVIDYLLAEYAAGRTPNPDVMCNREVKFGALWRFVRSPQAPHEAYAPNAFGAEYLATGHYAQRGRAADGSPLLRRGADAAKDQSYFLWAVPAEALAGALFPLGGMRKEETRALARAWHLPVAEKRDSQGICFLGSISVEDFLRHEFHPEPGVALDESGVRIGTHDGAILHTIGERVALTGSASGPWYVISKNISGNTLVVSNAKRPLDSQVRAAAPIKLNECNWFGATPESPLSAQYRYHGPIISGALSADRTTFTPSAPLAEPLAAGQSLVLYDGDRVAGGGIIA